VRILFASKHNYGGKQPVGGVQSWSKTLGQEFVKLGYEVVFWEPRKPAPDGAFDAGIFANVAFTGKLMALCRKTLVVSHGIIEDEMPVGGDVVAYTSEGVKRHWGGAGPIIRQPIDLGFWWQAEAPRKGVVRYSYRDGLEFLGPLCDKMGLPYRHVRGVTHEQAREAMHGASCVLATGRAALEAMACGAPVAICDDRGYQPPLVAYSIPSQMAENYSGRGGVEANMETVRAAINNAMQAGCQRRHVETHHDSRKIAEQVLCLLF